MPNRRRDDKHSRKNGVRTAAGAHLRQAAPRAGGGASSRRRSPRQRLGYDPTFHRAVAAGFLTPQEATRRGRRADFAARIAAEHGLPLGLATLVADNALSVKLARRRLAEIDPAAAISARRPRARRATLALLSTGGLGALAAAGALFLLGLNTGASATPAPRVQYGASARDQLSRAASVDDFAPPATWRFVETTRNDEGLPTRLVGPDPESVLIAFCSAAPSDAGVEAVGVAAAVPPSPGRVWGIFKLRGPSGVARRAIVIRYDPETLRWNTGDGRFVFFHDEDEQAFPSVEKWAVRSIRPEGSF